MKISFENKEVLSAGRLKINLSVFAAKFMFLTNVFVISLQLWFYSANRRSNERMVEDLLLTNGSSKNQTLSNALLGADADINTTTDHNDNNNASNKTSIVGIKPSKPLSQSNQNIISTANKIDLAYVDVSDGNKAHPHMGALDSSSQAPYKFNETLLKNNPPTLSIPNMEEVCKSDDVHYQIYTKIHVDESGHEAREIEAKHIKEKPRAKIFCMIYTVMRNADRINAVRETWGPKCDGFMAASDRTVEDMNSVQIPHYGVEKYENMWQKARSMWAFAYDNYYKDYDWFHIGGDDMYVIVENLRMYLESEEIQLAANGGQYLPYGNETEQTPLYLGRRFSFFGDHNRLYNTGGPGYTLNKAALKALVHGLPHCDPITETPGEDVLVADCLKKLYKIYPYDTRDENNGQRYMHWQPEVHVHYQEPKKKFKDPRTVDELYKLVNVDEIIPGFDQFSSHSISLHYIKPDAMRRMHALLYDYCALE